MDSRVKLREIPRGMRCSKLAKTGSSDIAHAVLRILRVLKEGCPELLCNTFELPMRTMRDDLDDVQHTH
jgi:hypothetical protein